MDGNEDKLVKSNSYTVRMGKYRRYFVLSVVVFGVVVVYVIFSGTSQPTGRLKANWKSTFHDRQEAALLKLHHDKSAGKALSEPGAGVQHQEKGRAIFIIGDSHIRRLDADIESGIINGTSQNFGLHRTVRIFGIPGATVDVLRNSETLISLLKLEKPEFVVLHVGGNDADSDVPIVQVCANIAAYNGELRSVYGVKTVLYSEQFHRYKSRSMPHKDYDRKIIEMNKILGSLYRKLFWTHTKLLKAKKDILSEDGVHLNAYGQQRFYDSIWDALKYLLSL